MHPAIKDLILLLFSANTSALGWFIAHNPSRAFQFFNFALQPERGLYVGFFRFLGWSFAVFGAVGTLMGFGSIIFDVVR
jgi:hypothetical protein